MAHKPVDDQPIHGEPPSKELLNGPIQERQCRDILCLLIYILATVAFIVILSIGYEQGQPERLTYAYDPDGRACGKDPDVVLAPYIYLVGPYPGHFNRSLCLRTCPQWVEGATPPERLECVTNSVVTSCQQSISIDGVNQLSNMSSILQIDYQNMDLDHLFNYSTFIYNSTDIFDRVCLPSGEKYVSAITGNMQEVSSFQLFQQWVGDIKLTWKIILASAGIAFAIGLFYMLLLRYCAGTLTWIAIFLYFVFLGLFIAYTKKQADFYQIQAEKNTQNGIQDSDNEDLRTQYAMYGLMITLIVITGISILALLCYFSRIRMAIAIIKTAALFVMEVPTVMFVPPVFTIIVMGFWALWITSFFYIYSIGDIKGRADSPFATVTWSENIRYYLIYHLFYGLWTNATIQAFSQFIIASSCCIWFYTQGNGQLINFYVLESVKRSLIYHFGSLVFGGLLLAIVQFIRFWLEYINYQMKQINGDKQQPLKCLLDCCRCYSACFERFVSFLNKNAFIQIALTGENFILAAKNGFHLIWNNAGQFAITNGIGNVFCTLCKLFISCCTTFICYQIITQSDAYKNKLNSPIVPTLLFFIISYIIGDLFMSVYGMAIDTVLQCAITEEELCKTNFKQQRNTPQPIKEFLDDYKKK